MFCLFVSFEMAVAQVLVDTYSYISLQCGSWWVIQQKETIAVQKEHVLPCFAFVSFEMAMTQVLVDTYISLQCGSQWMIQKRKTVLQQKEHVLRRKYGNIVRPAASFL